MQLSAPALIGRHAELAALDAALERTVKRRGGAVFLTGEAGIGKSRLARETASRARSEERRVGKECRSRGAPEDEKKKKIHPIDSVRLRLKLFEKHTHGHRQIER